MTLEKAVSDRVKCTKPLAPSAAKNAKSRSNQAATDQSTAKIVTELKNPRDSKLIGDFGLLFNFFLFFSLIDEKERF